MDDASRAGSARQSVAAWNVSTRRRRRLLIAARAIARVVAPSAAAYASANTPVAMQAAAGNTHSAHLGARSAAGLSMCSAVLDEGSLIYQGLARARPP